MTCQRAANDFRALGSAWQLSPQNTEQKISPWGGLRPLIGLLPVTALTNTGNWSDTNRGERKFIILRDWGEWKVASFWRFLSGIPAKLKRFPAETHGQHSNWQQCSLLRHSSALLLSQAQRFFLLINLEQDNNQTNLSLENERINKNRYWRRTFSSWISVGIFFFVRVYNYCRCDVMSRYFLRSCRRFYLQKPPTGNIFTGSRIMYELISHKPKNYYVTLYVLCSVKHVVLM